MVSLVVCRRWRAVPGMPILVPAGRRRGRGLRCGCRRLASARALASPEPGSVGRRGRRCRRRGRGRRRRGYRCRRDGHRGRRVGRSASALGGWRLARRRRRGRRHRQFRSASASGAGVELATGVVVCAGGGVGGVVGHRRRLARRRRRDNRGRCRGRRGGGVAPTIGRRPRVTTGVALGAVDGRGVAEGRTGVETCAVGAPKRWSGRGSTSPVAASAVVVGADAGVDEAAVAVATAASASAPRRRQPPAPRWCGRWPLCHLRRRGPRRRGVLDGEALAATTAAARPASPAADRSPAARSPAPGRLAPGGGRGRRARRGSRVASRRQPGRIVAAGGVAGPVPRRGVVVLPGYSAGLRRSWRRRACYPTRRAGVAAAHRTRRRCASPVAARRH